MRLSANAGIPIVAAVPPLNATAAKVEKSRHASTTPAWSWKCHSHDGGGNCMNVEMRIASNLIVISTPKAAPR